MDDPDIDMNQVENIWVLMRAWGAAVAEGKSPAEPLRMLRTMAREDPKTMQEAISLGCGMHNAKIETTKLSEADPRHPFWQLAFLEELREELYLS